MRDLIHREYNALSLVSVLDEAAVFQSHDVAREIKEAIKLYRIRPLPETLTLFSHILPSIQDPKTSQGIKGIDSWLATIAEEQWYECKEHDAPGLGFARTKLLLKALSIQVRYLEADIPSKSVDYASSHSPRPVEAMIAKVFDEGSPSVWLLCEIASHIQGMRHRNQWMNGQIIARTRMMTCLGRNTSGDKEILNWLYERWGHLTWPSGMPKDKETATAMMGKKKVKIDKIMRTGKPHAAMNWLLLGRTTGLEDAFELLQLDTEWWKNQHGPLGSLEGLKKWLVDEHNSSFHLDGQGWNGVAGNDPLSVLEASEERQSHQVKANQ